MYVDALNVTQVTVFITKRRSGNEFYSGPAGTEEFGQSLCRTLKMARFWSLQAVALPSKMSQELVEKTRNYRRKFVLGSFLQLRSMESRLLRTKSIYSFGVTRFRPELNASKTAKDRSISRGVVSKSIEPLPREYAMNALTSI